MIESKDRRNSLKSIARIYEMRVTDRQGQEVRLLDVFLKAGLDPTEVSDAIYSLVEGDIRATDSFLARANAAKS